MFTFILVTTIFTSHKVGLTEAECRWAVLNAQAAVLEYAPDSKFISARCEKEVP